MPSAENFLLELLCMAGKPPKPYYAHIVWYAGSKQEFVETELSNFWQVNLMLITGMGLIRFKAMSEDFSSITNIVVSFQTDGLNFTF